MIDYISQIINKSVRLHNIGFWKIKKDLIKLGIKIDKKSLLKRIKNARSTRFN
jgi:hypothetical protein